MKAKEVMLVCPQCDGRWQFTARTEREWATLARLCPTCLYLWLTEQGVPELQETGEEEEP